MKKTNIIRVFTTLALIVVLLAGGSVVSMAAGNSSSISKTKAKKIVLAHANVKKSSVKSWKIK